MPSVKRRGATTHAPAAAARNTSTAAENKDTRPCSVTGKNMVNPEKQVLSSKANSAGDAEALRHFEQAVMSGKHWYIALLEAIGLWTGAEEDYNGRTRRYLIAGEAFDWLLLAERMCETIETLLPEEEKNNLLFYGKPPLPLSPAEIEKLIGNTKYRQYLNYFYGIIVEDALLSSVRDEVYKERQMLIFKKETEVSDEAFRRIYNAERAELLEAFRQEMRYPQAESITLSELKEFTYWLFKYRLIHCEKARVASDTKKALKYLQNQWAKRGFCGVLAASEFSR
jgi:hypothetical protein